MPETLQLKKEDNETSVELREKLRIAEAENTELKAENENILLALERAGIDEKTALFRPEKFEMETLRLLEELNPMGGENRENALKAVVVFRIDVNKFKKFNEEPYNHDVGDKALRKISFRLISVTKQGDVLGRVGGDEFAIAMPIFKNDVDLERLSDDLKKRINDNLFVEYDGKNLPISVSLGYSALQNGQRKNIKQLLVEADLAERSDKSKTEVLEDYSI